jgi:hypothetical protein
MFQDLRSIDPVMTEPRSKARKSLGHSEQLAVKLHPELAAHVRQRAAANYQSPSEYIRSLIVADKRSDES